MDISRLLTEIAWLKDRVILEVRPLPLGRCNQNFRVFTDNGEFLLRVFGHKPLVAAIDRQQEFELQRLAFQRGVAAEPIVLSPQRDWMLCRYGVGVPLTVAGIDRDNVLGRMAQLLARLHRQSRPAGTLTLSMIAAGYWQQLAPNADAPMRLLWSRLWPGLAALDRQLTMTTLCHQDLNPGNWLVDGRGEMLLLDWEYAGAGDPHVDLASVAVEFNLSDQQQSALLAQYRQQGGPAIDPRRLRRCRVGYLALCWLWDEVHHLDEPGAYGRYRQLLEQALA